MLCSDGYADVKTTSSTFRSHSKCGYKILSQNAGLPCPSNAGCPTNYPDLLAKCTCTFNSYGNAYCEYESGNDEWAEIITLFKQYIIDTESCHISRGHGHHCFQPKKTSEY